MHMPSRKDLNSAALETIRLSRDPTTGTTANGEVQTNGEATVYVNDLEKIVTVQILEDTPAVLSLGKLCEDHGYSYEWTSGEKPHLLKIGRKIQCNTENVVLVIVLGFSTTSRSTSPTSPPQD